MNNGPTALYKHFDEEDNLLYVGVSLNHIARLSQHKSHSGWFKEIKKVKVEWHESRKSALDAETDAIVNDLPKHNIQKMPRHRYPDNPESQAEEYAESQANESLTKMVLFRPTYETIQVAQHLNVAHTAVLRMIESGELGHFTIRPNARYREKVLVSGWQLIDYLESVGAKPVVSADEVRMVTGLRG